MRIGLATAIFLVFLVLKLTDTVSWSWWWVTAPLWIPIVFIAVLAAIVGAFVLFGNVEVRKKQ